MIKSIIVPFYNEQESVKDLYNSIITVITKTDELIFINDGSKDDTPTILNEIAKYDSRVKVIHFSKNYGQTAAMMAGIDYATGNIIIPMDGDGQNDPQDINKLIDKLNEGYDVVSGWRKIRRDKTFSRKLPSKIANKIISWVTGVKLNDYGCSLKAYHSSILKSVRLYGEMHRFIPVYAALYGARVAEIPVNHHARTKGHSKYGINRIFKVFLDLLVVSFMQNYFTKPIYIMGGFGLFCFLGGLLSFLYALYLKLSGISFILTPLPLVSMTFFLMGFIAILIGLLSEVLMRTYYESQNKKPYHILSTVNIEQ